MPDLLRQACRLLRPQTRSLIDPEDVVSSALVSFLAHGDAAEPDDNLLLLLIAYVKRHCEKWNMRSRRHPSLSIQPSECDTDPGLEPSDAGPTPDELALFNDLIESVGRDLIDPEKEMFLLLLAGLSVTEISRQVGRVDRTVRRFREKILRLLQERGVGTQPDHSGN
jgi:DNA-directed RNA polymerase specialized sigma24 family protein